MLLEADELGFYRARARALTSLRGRPVTSRQRSVGTLRDVVFAAEGELRAVLLESGRRIPYDSSLGFAPERRTAA